MAARGTIDRFRGTAEVIANDRRQHFAVNRVRRIRRD